MPSDHALLGPSSAHRWLNCTPSARLEEGLPDTGNAYATDGTLAHRLGELLLRAEYEGMDITEELAEVQADPQYSSAMLEHMEDYVAFVGECYADAKSHCPDPRIFVEQRIEVSEYVPDGFGTADCVIIADGLMDVIDLKYGSGIPVSAEDNPQMKIYALGCLLAFSLFYEITAIRMTIYQPRLDSISTAVIDRGNLETWAAEYLKPRAALAYAGEGPFAPGAATCKWCKAGATCKARAEYQLELAAKDFQNAALMDNDEIAEVLERLPGLLSWAKQVKEYAEDAAINHGEKFPGFKVVEGRANRRYVNEGAIARRLKKAGFATADIYKPKELLGITAMEKLVGTKKLAELVGGLIEKPAGSPTLVPVSDKRPELNTAAKAAEDFADDIPQ
ncbi:DUF2800 domain-containing protein [Solibaculum mannosilyticum]|uniref:DUF2800 domain-containing protein n=1 Tax=Solibaculum mannosilyticum TaxID=2780922 RepID=A0A7I8D598_9FIRM|nr:DUF2800 domain-containing protein [Solibaculum mannosilyticum]BCI60619.1 hypothetical protein C12CBH8_12580 [Solibaculum mannosilyticum]